MSVYEQHASHVHEPTSQLRDVLSVIRSARALCETIGQPDEELRALEERAERYADVCIDDEKSPPKRAE